MSLRKSLPKFVLTLAEYGGLHNIMFLLVTLYICFQYRALTLLVYFEIVLKKNYEKLRFYNVDHDYCFLECRI